MTTTAPQFTLSHDAFGRLVLIDADGVRHANVAPVRAFPTSDPQRWISLVTVEGAELVCVPALDELPNTTREILIAELDRREFTPRITRIVSISSLTEPTRWTVETDRGPTQFVLESDSDVRRLSRNRAFIFDSHGTRYQVEDVRKLDARSRRYLERYL